jgi:hypothetical protein
MFFGPIKKIMFYKLVFSIPVEFFLAPWAKFCGNSEFCLLPYAKVLPEKVYFVFSEAESKDNMCLNKKHS